MFADVPKEELNRINAYVDQFNEFDEAGNRFHFSLEEIYNFLKVPEKYEQYSTSLIFRNDFMRTYLYDIDALIAESEDENDSCGDFIFMDTDNGIKYPWFSGNGFKGFCIMFYSCKM
jgi:hypothetical protein